MSKRTRAALGAIAFALLGVLMQIYITKDVTDSFFTALARALSAGFDYLRAPVTLPRFPLILVLLGAAIGIWFVASSLYSRIESHRRDGRSSDENDPTPQRFTAEDIALGLSFKPLKLEEKQTLQTVAWFYSSGNPRSDSLEIANKLMISRLVVDQCLDALVGFGFITEHKGKWSSAYSINPLGREWLLVHGG